MGHHNNFGFYSEKFGFGEDELRGLTFNRIALAAVLRVGSVG